MKGKIFLFETSVEEQNLSEVKGSPNSNYALGMAYLDSILQREGYEVITKDYATWGEETSLREIKRIVCEFKPDVVGISVMTVTRISTYKAIEEIKKINPSIKIILGGIHSSLMYDQLLKNYPIDAICIGEGDKTTPDLINALLTKRSLKNVKGIAYKKGASVIKTQPRDLVNELDDLPYPNHKTFMNPKRDTAIMLSSRGCPYFCTFCCIHTISKRKYRVRSPKNVVDEIEKIMNDLPQIKRIVFSDDTLTLVSSRMIKICEEIIKRGIHKKIKFICMARIKPASEEMFAMMAKAGFVEIRFGIETGDEEMMKNIHKGITHKDIIKTFKICSKFKDRIKFVKFLMVGFPGETWETVKATTRLVKELQKYIPMNIFYASVLWVFPGTEIYEIMKSKNAIDDDYWLTDKPAPYYTVEHSEAELKLMSDYISIKGAADRGLLFLIKITLQRIKQHPKYQIKRIIKNGFGLKLLRKF